MSVSRFSIIFVFVKSCIDQVGACFDVYLFFVFSSLIYGIKHIFSYFVQNSVNQVRRKVIGIRFVQCLDKIVSNFPNFCLSFFVLLVFFIVFVEIFFVRCVCAFCFFTQY